MKAAHFKDVSRLRERTGVGVLAANQALRAAKGDLDKAVELLRKSGQKVAAGKVSRQTREGAIGHYIHANGKIAVLVVVSCETDFVAKSQPFLELIHNLALHIAAVNPLYVKPEDIPPAILEQERSIYREQTKGMKKPAAMIKKIVDGKLEQYFEESCLLRQKFVKDETQKVADLITAAVQKLGENIQVREFVRLSL
ncbi:MAG: elongation factor Ts [Candidatus Kerfeldbacteria bacterium]|nr:elongation factor Ts [Candidatus Kerfeldbacteria bacterium]